MKATMAHADWSTSLSFEEILEVAQCPIIWKAPGFPAENPGRSYGKPRFSTGNLRFPNLKYLLLTKTLRLFVENISFL